VVQHDYGHGADEVWVLRRPGTKPKAVVVFLHGLADVREETPTNHLPWLRHLAARGDAVIYPRYETVPGGPGAVRHAVQGLVTGMVALDAPTRLPVVVVGYSRGGGLALDVAALAPAVSVFPRAVLSVFPAMLDPPIDYRLIPARTPIVFLVGDHDTSVSHVGRDNLVELLRLSRHPMRRVRTEVVRSKGSFYASHLAPLETSPGARRAFWDRADRLVDEAVARAG
jgi:pimeloyl-ACP methyl ester carboxylesterase